jgi:hypothetical protein
MTRTITKHALENARRFVRTHGRPLDQAYLACLEPSGAAEDALGRLLRELAAFQTPEGGFGRAIEPDLRTPTPTPFATSVALQYLRSAGAPASLPLVKAAIDYLVRTIDRQSWMWPAVDERIEDAPHAPWWMPTPELRSNVLNPSAELLGYLYDYRQHAPDEIIDRVTARVLGAIENAGAIAGAYDLICCMRLVQTDSLPATVRETLERVLRASLAALDPEDVHFDALAVVPTPSSFGYEFVQARIDRQAEGLIGSQGEDGGWSPFWDWSEVDADAWAKAKAEWRSVLTRQAIVSLSSHKLVAE